MFFFFVLIIFFIFINKISFVIKNTTEYTQILTSTLVKASQIIVNTIVSDISFSNIVATSIQGRKLYTVNLFTPSDNSW